MLTARYNELNTTLDSIISDANSQLTSLNDKIASRSPPPPAVLSWGRPISN